MHPIRLATLILSALAGPALAQPAQPSPSGETMAADAPPPAADAAPSAAQAAPPAEPAPDAAAPPTVRIGDDAAPGAPPPVTEPAPASDGTQLDDIEVTATRRREKLIDVPVAVTAFTSDQIEARRIGRLDDLNSLSPGLQISRSPSNTTISQITIRGSSQINPAIYWDPAVGVYVDGVYIGKSQGAIFDLVDLVGVEVLRGPQGTLYGRNTIGGTINFVTKEPSGTFGGEASVEYGSFNDRVARASLDLPRLAIVDVSLGVRSERRDGWVETTDGSSVDELNDRHNDGAHFAARMDLLPRLEAIYRFDWNKVDQGNTFDQLYRSDDPTLAEYVSQERETQASVDAPSFERFRLNGHSLTLSWDLSEHALIKSITGYRKVKWEDSLDLDGSDVDQAFTQRFTDYEQKSEDLNLTGRWSDLKYVAGVFWFQDEGYTNNPQHFVRHVLNFDSRYGTTTDAWAAYGQVDWNVIEPLTITAGLRYTSEKKGLERVFGLTPLPPAFLALLPAEVQAAMPAPAANGYIYYMPEGFRAPDKKFTATSPQGSVAWKFNEHLNTYVRYAYGFKSGGYNGEFSDIQQTPEANQQETLTPFRPEKQKSLEAGVKTSFWDGRATLNAAVFRNKLTDLQVSTFTGGGAAASVVRNAGKATVKGVELEAAISPFDGTTLRANYAYLKPRYDEFLDTKPAMDDDPLDQQTVPADVADNRAFVHAPKHAWNVVLDSTVWEGRWGALRAVADYAWTGSFYTYPYQLTTQDPGYNSNRQDAEHSRVDAYGILNARLAWTQVPLFGSTTGELAAWGRNLLDDDTAYNFIDFGPGAFMNLTVANFVEPRTVGVSAVVRF